MTRTIETTMTDELWQEGTVANGKYRYLASVWRIPSLHGIDNGNISKLSIRDREGNEVAHYDRGWVEKPHLLSDARSAVKSIVQFYKDNAHSLPAATDKTAPEAEVSIPDAQHKDSGTVRPEPVNSNPMGFFQGKTRKPDLTGVRLVPETEFERVDFEGMVPKGPTCADARAARLKTIAYETIRGMVPLEDDGDFSVEALTRDEIREVLHEALELIERPHYIGYPGEGGRDVAMVVKPDSGENNERETPAWTPEQREGALRAEREARERREAGEAHDLDPGKEI